ncbi:MAG: penicillin acylase family protein, partial [Solirubrobacterales bacterium]|nr:penicillin acylase family protein [Solirubrobacterales bacterium]
TQQDLTNHINWAAPDSPDGPQILSDATNYVDGINAYIAKAESPLNALTMLPAEYAAIGQPQGPQPFTVEDLRSVLGDQIAGPLNREYCGGGSLAACRSALESSLREAIAEPAQQVYPADGVCAAGEQMCADSIQFRPIGVISQPLVEWINRPTFQQADEIQGHRPG